MPMPPIAQRVAALTILLWCVVGISQGWRREPITSQPMLALQNASRVDLNSATFDELQLLPRIGPALAQRIIDDRELNGPFTSVEDIQRVKGIGPRTLDKLRHDATTVPPTD